MQARNESGVTYANPGVDLLQYSPQFPLAVAGLQPPLPPYPGVEVAYCFSPHCCRPDASTIPAPKGRAPWAGGPTYGHGKPWAQPGLK